MLKKAASIKQVPPPSQNGTADRSQLAASSIERYLKLLNQKWPTEPKERKEFEKNFRRQMAAANRDWDRAFDCLEGREKRIIPERGSIQ